MFEVFIVIAASLATSEIANALKLITGAPQLIA